MENTYKRGGDSNYNICNGCKTAIGDGDGYVNALRALWHRQCLLCLHCHKPFSENEIKKLKRKSHEICFETFDGLPCYVCRNKLPTFEKPPSTKKDIKFRKHPFWAEMYCPHHEDDGTLKCCSCERLKAYGTTYVTLPDNRWLCLDCMKTSVKDDDQFRLLKMDVLGFLQKDLDIKVEQELIPIHLVSEQVMKRAKQTNNIDNEDGTVTRGLCLSRGRRVVGILILNMLPRLLTGCILAHEMMHAYRVINGMQSCAYGTNKRAFAPGYKRLNKSLEEGICQVVGHMWLKSHRSSLASSSRTTNPSDQSNFEKKLMEFGIHQIETDETQYYGVGFRKVDRVMALNNYNIKDTMTKIQEVENKIILK